MTFNIRSCGLDVDLCTYHICFKKPDRGISTVLMTLMWMSVPDRSQVCSTDKDHPAHTPQDATTISWPWILEFNSCYLRGRPLIGKQRTGEKKITGNKGEVWHIATNTRLVLPWESVITDQLLWSLPAEHQVQRTANVWSANVYFSHLVTKVIMSMASKTCIFLCTNSRRILNFNLRLYT